MDLKKFEEYTPDEKVSLLTHWFHYYGKCLYTFADIENFRKTAETNADDLIKIITTGYEFYAAKQGPDPSIVILETVRRPFLMKELLNSVPDYSLLSEDVKTYMDGRQALLLKEIVETYNNPQPDVPMDIIVTVEASEGKPKNKKKTRNKRKLTEEVLETKTNNETVKPEEIKE